MVEHCSTHGKNCDVEFSHCGNIIQKARRQEFPEGGYSDSQPQRESHTSLRYYGRGSEGRSRPPEALGYLVQNPAI